MMGGEDSYSYIVYKFFRSFGLFTETIVFCILLSAHLFFTPTFEGVHTYIILLWNESEKLRLINNTNGYGKVRDPEIVKDVVWAYHLSSSKRNYFVEWACGKN